MYFKQDLAFFFAGLFDNIFSKYILSLGSVKKIIEQGKQIKSIKDNLYEKTVHRH